jgi:hypothetical protein
LEDEEQKKQRQADHYTKTKEEVDKYFMQKLK